MQAFRNVTRKVVIVWHTTHEVNRQFTVGDVIETNGITGPITAGQQHPARFHSCVVAGSWLANCVSRLQHPTFAVKGVIVIVR